MNYGSEFTSNSIEQRLMTFESTIISTAEELLRTIYEIKDLNIKNTLNKDINSLKEFKFIDESGVFDHDKYLQKVEEFENIITQIITYTTKSVKRNESLKSVIDKLNLFVSKSEDLKKTINIEYLLSRIKGECIREEVYCIMNGKQNKITFNKTSEDRININFEDIKYLSLALNLSGKERLDTLDLSNTDIAMLPEDLKYLKLEKLIVSNTEIDKNRNSNLKIINKLSNLKKLDLRGLSLEKITDGSLDVFVLIFNKLNKLYLSSRNDNLDTKKMQKIKHLHLNRMKEVPFDIISSEKFEKVNILHCVLKTSTSLDGLINLLISKQPNYKTNNVTFYKKIKAGAIFENDDIIEIKDIEDYYNTLRKIALKIIFCEKDIEGTEDDISYFLNQNLQGIQLSLLFQDEDILDDLNNAIYLIKSKSREGEVLK